MEDMLTIDPPPDLGMQVCPDIPFAPALPEIHRPSNGQNDLALTHQGRGVSDRVRRGERRPERGCNVCCRIQYRRSETCRTDLVWTRTRS